MKLDLSCNKNLKDRHVKTLVKRCNKITELKLSHTTITDDSLDSIATYLNSSLEKLDVSYTEIGSTAILQLRSIETLKVLHYCLKRSTNKNSDELKNLRKNLPQLSINKVCHLFSIASTTDTFQYEYGFWEIKAEFQELFTEKIRD